eukprot:1699028-Rhodomonas_salina.1
MGGGGGEGRQEEQEEQRKEEDERGGGATKGRKEGRHPETHFQTENDLYLVAAQDTSVPDIASRLR